MNLTKEYLVEQKVKKGDLIGLDKEGLALYPGSQRGFSVSYNPTTRRYKTGLDEFAPEVIAIKDTKARQEKIEWIKTTRQYLEEQAGQVGILDATNSDFWDLWCVWVEVDETKQVKVMGSHPQFKPELYWEHKLALITLEANENLPLSKKDIGNPKWKDSPFYVTTKEEEATFTKERNKKERLRHVELNKLFGEGGAGFERAWSIAFLLGVQKEPNIGIEKLEEVLDIFTSQKEYLDSFLELCKRDNDDLAVDVIIRKAIDYDVIKFNPADKVYYRGGFNFRATADEVSKMFKQNMTDPSYAREFIEIRDKVGKIDLKRKK